MSAIHKAIEPATATAGDSVVLPPASTSPSPSGSPSCVDLRLARPRIIAAPSAGENYWRHGWNLRTSHARDDLRHLSGLWPRLLLQFAPLGRRHQWLPDQPNPRRLLRSQKRSPWLTNRAEPTTHSRPSASKTYTAPTSSPSPCPAWRPPSP